MFKLFLMNTDVGIFRSHILKRGENLAVLLSSFQLGGWQAGLCACTVDVEMPARCFGDFINAFLGGTKPINLRYVIVASTAIMDETTCPSWLPSTEQKRWEYFHTILKSTYLNYRQAQSIGVSREQSAPDLFCFTWPKQDMNNLNQQSYTCKQEEKIQYNALITSCPSTLSHISIWGYIFSLATQWHVERGGICLHSAAICRGNDGFLFLGHSGAGKSTVAQMSARIGLSPLGDDLNFVINNIDKGYLLAAAPSPTISATKYSMFKPSLRGIFTLVQDERDYLIPVPTKQMVRILFDSFYQQASYVRRMPANLYRNAFQTACDIARRIPGYELHFRRSSCFWNVIDERFPN